MNSKLDEILESGALAPPRGFTLRVMQRIANLPEPQRVRNGPAWVPWVAAFCAIAFGVEGLASFIFSAWIAATAY